MARLPRLTVPGLPHHVIQRGNDRQPIVRDDADRRHFLELFATAAREHHVAIHAYVLMDNHLHLLATPQDATGLPALMQSVGRRYVRHFNDRHHRTGALWEGRYRSTLVQTDRYLLACMAYIELNPVRAGMVAAPADFPWSSHRANVGLATDRLVTPHPMYWALGDTPFAREQAYAALVAAGIPDPLRERLTTSALKGWALGDEAFVRQLEGQTTRRATQRQAGRPPAPVRQPVPNSNGDLNTGPVIGV